MLAVGLALRGFQVSASDASPAMVERTRKLASEHGVALEAMVSRWDELTSNITGSPFSAVFCVGNSLTHTDDRRTALRAMRSVLTADGLLVITSRNWEKVRAEAADSEEVVERSGVLLRVGRSWHIPANWHDPHYMDIEVGAHRERLSFWPFTHDQLHDDLRAAGFEPRSSSYTRDADRYVVTAT
jgi:SAM-dependent methyltransferase